MKDEKKSRIVKYAVTALIGGLIAFVAFALRNFGAAENAAERYRILCDSFTFPGVLLILTAALIALSNEGAFVGIGYAFSHTLRMLIPGMGGRQETYAEYLERKTGKGRVKGYGFILHVGLAYFAVALLFLVLFYMNFEG